MEHFECVEDRIAVRLVNTGKHKEFLETVPSFEFLDLSAVCFALMGTDPKAFNTVTITNEHLKEWKITQDRLFEKALDNTRKLMGVEISTLQQKVCEFADGINDNPAGNYDTGTYVLTNKFNIFGAANILFPDVLDKCADIFGGDFRIVPSSVHEILMIPMDFYADTKLLDMTITEINAIDEPANNLAWHSYVYASDLHEVMI